MGTETPSPTLLDRRPYSASASLINRRMIRHVVIQAAFQLGALLVLLRAGDALLGIDGAFLDAT